MRFVQGKLWRSTGVLLLGVAVLFSINACDKEVSMDGGGGPTLSGLEHDILREINRVRTDPAAYASTVAARKQQYDKQMAKLGPTQQEAPVFDEAIRALQATAPLPALTVSRGLSLAAKEHVSQAGSPAPAFEERLKHHGTWEGSIAENVAYGSDTAQRFVMQFVLDPDDARRTQRANILQPGFTMGGIACGSHPQYTTMCVVTFARKYSDKMP